MSEERHVKPIKKELRPILNRFLAHSEYQTLFMQFAVILGYKGDDIEEAKKALFYPNDDGELGFTIAGMYDLFLEFQLLEQIMDKEPYKTLLKEKPTAIREVREFAKRVLNGDEVTNEDVIKLFSNDNGSQ